MAVCMDMYNSQPFLGIIQSTKCPVANGAPLPASLASAQPTGHNQSLETHRLILQNCTHPLKREPQFFTRWAEAPGRTASVGPCATPQHFCLLS